MPDTLKSDATPTYRGYRRQILYTLFRILTDDRHLIFRPEGKEDLAVFDEQNNLQEVVQVKDHSEPLRPSDFSPEKRDSFFKRVSDDLKTHSDIKVSIVSFGEISPKLRTFEGNKQQQKTRAKELIEYGFLSEKEAFNLITKIRLEQVQEDQLLEKIYSTLQDNSITGGDYYTAFDTLMFWLYQCAEHKTAITHHDVIEKFTNIGRFINDRHAYHQEWFTIIEPIEYRKLDEQEYSELSRQFYEGISAQYDHILAELDVKRHQKMQEIDERFKQNRVVIVHAASGQGKTTLAYRYLHDCFPDMFRYRVKLVQDRRHAHSIARALTKYAEAIGIPIAVYYDVSANDRDWGEFVKVISKDRNIVLLVTIREEDFRRAFISGAEVQFSEVELNLERPEAEGIFQSLTAKQISAEFLNFDEAWNRFRGEESSRPLMEFVYLITQGNTLQERLQEQVKRIQDDILSGKFPPAILDLLRLVAVASAFEAKLKYGPLVNHLDLLVPERIFELLEKEYSLLKLGPKNLLVEGLHPIRSAILTDILTTPPSPSWSEIASTCLPFIHEPDLEVFLLYAFSRHQEATESLLNTLMAYQSDRWVAFGGIVRALIWLGISDYVKANQALIREIFEVAGESWYGALDFDIADAVPGVTTELSEGFGKWGSETARKNIQALQACQTDKRHVFSHVKKWLAKQDHQPSTLTSEADWSSMAETVFWIGHLHIQLPVADWVSETELENAITVLPLEILANLVLGLSYGYGQNFLSWLERNRSNLTHRFCQETNTVVLEDDGQKLTLHFLLSLELEKDSQSENISHIQAAEHSFHEEALQRIWLLRRLLPDRETYASRGYGHRLWGTDLPIDETDKPGVPRSALPLLWLRSINSTFRGLVNYSFRPENWLEYANTILEQRKTILETLTQLEQALNFYFRKKKVPQLFGNLIDTHKWNNNKHLITQSPMLPRCATDEWGKSDEFTGEAKLSPVSVKSIAAQKYEPFLDALDAFKKYTWQLYLFIEQSPHVMLINQQLKNSKNIKIEKEKILTLVSEHGIKDFARLSVMNFGDAVKMLSKFQREFRQLLVPFLDSVQLEKLEHQEQQLFNQVWALWYVFALYPNRVLQNPQQECSKRLKNAVQEVRKQLRRNLKKLSSNTLQIQIASETILWEENPALWLTIDGKKPIEVYSSVEDIVRAIRKAVHRIEEPVLRQSFLPFHWSSVAIVPLVRGKSLNAEAWHINMDLLTVGEKEEELSWWNLITQPIPQEAFTKLSFEIWDLPRLEVGARLFQSITALSLFVAHIRDLKRIPESDEQGIAQLQAYLHHLSIPVSQVFQLARDAIHEIETFYNELSHLQHNEIRSNLTSVMQGLADLKTILFPKSVSENEMLLKMKDVVEWTTRLEKARDIAFSSYLFWVEDVLDEEGV